MDSAKRLRVCPKCYHGFFALRGVRNVATIAAAGLSLIGDYQLPLWIDSFRKTGVQPYPRTDYITPALNRENFASTHYLSCIRVAVVGSNSKRSVSKLA